MNVVIQIQGRDAIPVRALPFVTCWFLGSEELAATLSNKGKPGEVQRLKAYQLDDGKVKTINPSVWTTAEFDIHCLTASLKAKQGEFSDWQQGAILKLPAATFVWKDDFEQWFTQTFLDEDSRVDLLENLNSAIVGIEFSPLISADFQSTVMEGFLSANEKTGPKAQEEVSATTQAQAAPEIERPAVPVESDVARKDKFDAPEHGLLTKEIAHAFDGVYGRTAARWTKNLSAAKWTNPCRIGRGEQGGASAVWRPLLLAQLIHGKTKGDKAKEKVLKLIHSRFTRLPALAPWRDAFNEYFATYSAAD